MAQQTEKNEGDAVNRGAHTRARHCTTFTQLCPRGVTCPAAAHRHIPKSTHRRAAATPALLRAAQRAQRSRVLLNHRLEPVLGSTHQLIHLLTPLPHLQRQGAQDRDGQGPAQDAKQHKIGKDQRPLRAAVYDGNPNAASALLPLQAEGTGPALRTAGMEKCPPPKSSAALTKGRPLFQSLRTWKVGIALMPQAAATACSARGQVGSLPSVR